MKSGEYDNIKEKIQKKGKSDNLLRYIIEHMRSAVAVHDRELRYIYVSQRYLQEYNVEEKDIIGRHHYEVFPDLPEKWREVHRRCLRGEIISAEDDMFVRADGSAEYTRWECRPWYDAEGGIGGIIVYTEVITKYKMIEQALLTSRERYKSIFDNSPIGIALVDTMTGQYLQVNREFCRITGRSEEELLDTFYQDITYREDRYRGRYLMERIIRGEIGNYSIQKRYVRPDGQLVWVSATISRYSKEKRLCHLNMIRDITEEKRRDERLEYLRDHDSLTGLNNRTSAEFYLQEFNCDTRMPLALLMLDINGLKLVNDAFGNKKGDQLLCQVAEIMNKLELPEESVKTRIGGDEFAILMPGTDMKTADGIRQMLVDLVSNSKIEDVVLSISAGVAVAEQPLEDMNELYRLAEDRMNRFKLSEGSSMRSKTIDLILNSLHEKNLRELNHSHRVSEISTGIASCMGLSQEAIKRIRLAGLMHDIGKIGIPDSVLNKPGRLTAEEWNEIRKHSEKGYHILSAANEFSEIADYVLQHHERWDGKGYPQGLAADAIKLEARIICLADAFDAMTSDRSYRQAMKTEDAVEEIRRCRGTQFDPAVADAFIDYYNSRPEIAF